MGRPIIHPRIESKTVYYVRSIFGGTIGPLHHIGIAQAIADEEDAERAKYDNMLQRAVVRDAPIKPGEPAE